VQLDSQEPIIYSPSAVLNIFNNSISLKQTQRIIQLRGIFVMGKGAFYNGSYYDSLRDESADAQITLVVPALIRNELQHNKTVTINGYITRRVVNNASRIEIQLTVTELVGQTQNKYSDEELKRIELQQAKASAGFRDVQSWIKEKILLEQPFRIAVIIGKTAIIDSDIKHQLRESLAFYRLDFQRINLSSETEIISTIRLLDENGVDIIVVSRGGGENLDIFNRVSIAEQVIKLRSVFITAIGHKDDVTLLQKVADKAFITPSELGQFLNDTYNHTIEEAQHSRAQLVESVTKQLTAGYQKEIDNLKEQVKNLEELKKQSSADMQRVYEEKIKGINHVQQEKHELYEQRIAELRRKANINWVAVIVAVVVGLILGYLVRSR